MAPEVQRGLEATPRSDLYSLGVLLREAFPTLPSRLAYLVSKLTEVDAAARPASAAAAAALLEPPTAATVQMATGPTAAIPGRSAVVARSRRRRWALALVPLALLGALALAVVWTGGDDARITGTRGSAVGGTTSDAGVGAGAGSSAAPTTPTTGNPQGLSPTCEQLEAEKADLEEQKKAAEERLKEDEDAKAAALRRFEERRHRLEEDLAACRGRDDKP